MLKTVVIRNSKLKMDVELLNIGINSFQNISNVRYDYILRKK